MENRAPEWAGPVEGPCTLPRIAVQSGKKRNGSAARAVNRRAPAGENAATTRLILEAHARADARLRRKARGKAGPPAP